MNPEQIKSLVRQAALILFGSAFLAPVLARWGISLEDLPGIIDNLIIIGSAIAGAVASIYALWNRSKKELVAKAAEVVPIPEKSQEKVGIPPSSVVTPTDKMAA